MSDLFSIFFIFFGASDVPDPLTSEPPALELHFIKEDIDLAEEALVDFSVLLSEGKYSEAAKYYKNTTRFADAENPSIRFATSEELLRNDCEERKNVNDIQCLKIKDIVHKEVLKPGESSWPFKFVVQYSNPDGSLFFDAESRTDFEISFEKKDVRFILSSSATPQQPGPLYTFDQLIPDFKIGDWTLVEMNTARPSDPSGSAEGQSELSKQNFAATFTGELALDGVLSLNLNRPCMLIDKPYETKIPKLAGDAGNSTFFCFQNQEIAEQLLDDIEDGDRISVFITAYTDYHYPSHGFDLAELKSVEALVN